MKLLFFVLLLPLALAGCKRDSAGQGDAPLPVLSGTISDAMLPFDTATSKPPPLDPGAVRGARGTDGAPTDGASASAEAQGTAAPDQATM